MTTPTRKSNLTHAATIIHRRRGGVSGSLCDHISALPEGDPAVTHTHTLGGNDADRCGITAMHSSGLM